MNELIYEWLLKEIKKEPTKSRVEAVFNITYLLRKAGYSAPEWESIFMYVSQGHLGTYIEVVYLVENTEA